MNKYRLVSIIFFGIAVVCLFFPWVSSGYDSDSFDFIYQPAYQVVWMQPIIIVGYLGFLCTVFIPKFQKGPTKIVPLIGLLILVLGLLNLAFRQLIGYGWWTFSVLELFVTEFVEPAFLVVIVASIASFIMYAIYLKTMYEEK
ncbi:hypothetical protein HB981_11500 [Listeria seeligeri]|uniref:hypothetical protein n=1 Tax=Listeria seeligeri TaxID=1640 RepID=UPI00162980FE|nr:hypothetical protein [Listeria seeligeri]MBC1478964.1 hypothetical protein [Listeria seeligeri]MBC1539651.1 hypothetical protein [Listeria seeligeri]MBC1556699.1 hypothetical protein [Listeria seeligeri]MBC1721821.1 hypothetical protein [Listeria seeligeri]MBC1727111.1 hypothetical protein [Listeria seeligeri]